MQTYNLMDDDEKPGQRKKRKDDLTRAIMGRWGNVEDPEPTAGPTVAARRRALPEIQDATFKGDVKMPTNDEMFDLVMNVSNPLEVAGTVAAKAVGKVTANEAVQASRAKMERDLAQLMTRLREKPWKDALKSDKKGAHLKMVEGEGYVGGPSTIKTEKDLKAARKSYDAAVAGGVENGVDGSSWYSRIRDDATRAFPNDPAKQTSFAQTNGMYSAQADPEVNLGFTLRQWAARLTGDRDLTPRFPAQRDKFWNHVETGQPIPAGPKTEPYTLNIDPTKPRTGMGVNDIINGRNWGHANPDGTPWDSGYTLSQHGWMDGETRLAADRANKRSVGGKTDWQPEEVQASSWIYKKALDVADEPRFGGDLRKALEWANKTYGDYYPKHTIFATNEQIPGANTGHLTGVQSMPLAEREAYSRVNWDGAPVPTQEMLDSGRPLVTDPYDILYTAAGNPQAGATQSATGTFAPAGGGALETNPMRVARPLVALKDGMMDSNSRKTVEAVERFRALMGGQEASAAHRLSPQGALGAQNSFFAEMPSALSEQQARGLSSAASPYEFGLADTGRGTSFLYLPPDVGPKLDGGTVKRMLTKGQLGRDLEQAGLRSERVRQGALDSVYEPSKLEDFTPGSGGATREMLAKVDATDPSVADGIGESPVVRDRVLKMMERDASVSQALGLPLREDLQRLRQIFAESGFKGVREALAAGVLLPAAAMMVLKHDPQSQRAKTPNGSS